MRRWSGSIIEILIILSIIGIIAGIAIPNFLEFQRRRRHGSCIEWQDDGAIVCYGSNTYSRCEHDRVCVRYKDGSTP